MTATSTNTTLVTDYATTLPGGSHWSLRVRRGTVMRLTAQEADTNVGMLFYNPENLLERYNAPDTLKGQHTFKLTAGHCLYSDMGRVFCSIIEDSLGWHDTVGGNLTRTLMERKGWPYVSFQHGHNKRTQTGDTSFLVELAKYGLGARDMAANLNLFSKVVTDDGGNMRYAEGHCQPGAHVTLRFEMDTLVLLHTCPHPLDPAEAYPHRSVEIALGTAPAPAADDPCRISRPENARAFENNRLYYIGADQERPAYTTFEETL